MKDCKDQTLLKRDSTLEAKEEYEEYMNFGLGYAVDASDPSPLKSKRGKVRTVLYHLSNVEEGTKKERDSYKQIISSMKSHESSVSASVSDIVGKVVTLSAEAEYARGKFTEMIASGNNIKVIASYFFKDTFVLKHLY